MALSGLQRLTALARARPDASVALGLGLLPFAVLGRALLPGRALSPADILLGLWPWSAIAPATTAANPLLGDVALQFHPWTVWAAREIREGRVPLWNPYAYAGAPFFANPQTALLFPLTALAYVLPPALALTLMSILKLSLAALGMYWFLRLLSLRALAAAMGAIAFTFSGALVAWLQWPFGTAMALIPVLFGATERLCQREGRGWVVGLALAVASSIFAGYLQVAMLAWLAAGAWALSRARGVARPGVVLARWGCGAGLGVLLGGVQLLPFVEYLGQSSVYFYRSQWMPVMAAPLGSAITLLMPYYYGSPGGHDFWGYWNFNETAATVGIVPWVALPAALLGAWSRHATRFFVALAAVSAVMFYEIPGVTDAVASLPPFSFVISQRAGAFLVFALAALGALGIEALLAAPRTRRLRGAVRAGFAALVIVAFIVLVRDRAVLAHGTRAVSLVFQYLAWLALLTLAALAALRIRCAGGAVPGACLALVVAELASVLPLAATYNPVVGAHLVYPPAPPAVRHLQTANREDPGRVLFPAGANLGMLYGLPEVTGYDAMTPRRIERLASPIGAGGLLGSGPLGPGNVTVSLASPVFDLLGVRRIVVPPGVDALPSHFALEYDGPDGRVYRNPRALPRAFLVHRARCVDDGTALRLMHTGAVDFRQEVLLDSCEGPPGAPGPGRVARAEIRRAELGRVVVDAEMDAAGYLVLTDTWFPGWRARVDGVERPVRRGDYAFRAVALGAGRHVVEFRYRPRSVRFGLALSALAALVLAALGVTSRARRDG